MRNLTFSLILAAALLSRSSAQDVAPLPNRVQISSKLADTLLIHREEPTCEMDQDGVRVTGTVVFAITIGKNGRVSHIHILSGPLMLRPLATATVRKFRYKPYLHNKTPVEAVTVVSIPIDCFFHTGQA